MAIVLTDPQGWAVSGVVISADDEQVVIFDPNLRTILTNELDIYRTALLHVEKLAKQVECGMVTREEALHRINEIHAVTCAG